MLPHTIRSENGIASVDDWVDMAAGKRNVKKQVNSIERLREPTRRELFVDCTVR